MICPCCLGDGLDIRRDVKGRPYAVHAWCCTRLFLQNDVVLGRLVERQAGIAELVARRGGALALQAEAMEPAPAGTAPSAECRCPVCMVATASAIRFDKKQRAFTRCRACQSVTFHRHPIGLTAVRLQSPGVLSQIPLSDVLSLTLCGGRFPPLRREPSSPSTAIGR